MKIAIDLLATSRITKIVVEDEIARPGREWIARTFPDTQLTYLITCPACVSVWAGAAVQILPRPVRYALALSQLTLASKWASDAVEAAIRR